MAGAAALCLPTMASAVHRPRVVRPRAEEERNRAEGREGVSARRCRERAFASEEAAAPSRPLRSYAALRRAAARPLRSLRAPRDRRRELRHSDLPLAPSAAADCSRWEASIRFGVSSRLECEHRAAKSPRARRAPWTSAEHWRLRVVALQKALQKAQPQVLQPERQRLRLAAPPELVPARSSCRPSSSISQNFRRRASRSLVLPSQRAGRRRSLPRRAARQSLRLAVRSRGLRPHRRLRRTGLVPTLIPTCRRPS